MQREISILGASFSGSSDAQLQSIEVGLAGVKVTLIASSGDSVFARVPLEEGRTISKIDVVVLVRGLSVIALLDTVVDSLTTSSIASSPPSSVGTADGSIETLTIDAGNVQLQAGVAYVITVQSVRDKLPPLGKFYVVSRATIHP